MWRAVSASLEELHERFACRAFLAGQRRHPPAGRPSAAAARGDGTAGAGGRIPLPAGRRLGPASRLLRVVRRRVCSGRPSTCATPPSRCTRPSRTSSTRSSATPTNWPVRATPTCTAWSGAAVARTRERGGPALPFARVLVHHGVRGGPRGRRAAGVRRGHPFVGRGDVRLSRGRSAAGRPGGHGPGRLRHHPLPARPVCVVVGLRAGGSARAAFWNRTTTPLPQPCCARLGRAGPWVPREGRGVIRRS